MRGRNEAFTLLEAMIAMAVIGIGAMGLLAAFASIASLSSATEREMRADAMMTERLAEIAASAALNFEDTVANYSGLNTDFTLMTEEGIEVQVICYLNEAAVPAQFGQAPDGGGLDLDGDGLLTGDYTFAEVAPDYSQLRLLPVEVRAVWQLGRIDMTTQRFALYARRR